MKVSLLILLLLVSPLAHAQEPTDSSIREGMLVLYKEQVAKDRQVALDKIEAAKSALSGLVAKAANERKADIESLEKVRKYYRDMKGYCMVYDSSTGTKLGFAMQSSSYKGRIKVLIGKDLSGLEVVANAIKENDLKSATDAIKRLPWHDEPSAISDAEEGEFLLELSEEASTAKQLVTAANKWDKEIQDSGKVFSPDYRPLLNPFEMKADDMGQLPPFVSLKAFQVLSPSSMLMSVEWGRERTLVYIMGRSTKGIADGQQLKIKDVFIVSGTETYETTGGSGKTVFVIIPAFSEHLKTPDLTATVHADDTADYLSEHRTQLRKAVELYTEQLDKQRTLLAKQSRDASSSEELMESVRDDIARYERYLKHIQDDGAGFRPALDLPRKLKVGMFGAISHNRYWPDEVVPVEVFQVVDERNALVKFWNDLVWVSGLPTTDLVDGKTIVLKPVFKVTGTKRYQSAGGGSNTVYLLELFDTTRADAILEKERDELRRSREELRKKEAEELKRARTREFTDLTGKFKVMAEYRGYENGLVILRRTDNDKEVRVALGKLSAKDRAWVSSIIRKDR